MWISSKGDGWCYFALATGTLGFGQDFSGLRYCELILKLHTGLTFKAKLKRGKSRVFSHVNPTLGFWLSHFRVLHFSPFPHFYFFKGWWWCCLLSSCHWQSWFLKRLQCTAFIWCWNGSEISHSGSAFWRNKTGCFLEWTQLWLLFLTRQNPEVGTDVEVCLICIILILIFDCFVLSKYL